MLEHKPAPVVALRLRRTVGEHWELARSFVLVVEQDMHDRQGRQYMWRLEYRRAVDAVLAELVNAWAARWSMGAVDCNSHIVAVAGAVAGAVEEEVGGGHSFVGHRLVHRTLLLLALMETHQLRHRQLLSCQVVNKLAEVAYATEWEL